MIDLKGKIIAILATDGFEEEELVKPMQALKEHNAEIHIVATKSGKIKAWDHGEWSREYNVDKEVSKVSSRDYDGLLLPGGVINPDKLRREESAVNFVRGFFDDKKPVAAICHGPWLLVEAEVARGKRLTSFPSIRKDLENAGAKWEDKSVVVDSGLVTSRSPEDMGDFISKAIEEFNEGKHSGQSK